MASGGTNSAWTLDEKYNRYYRTWTDVWGNQQTQWAPSQTQSQAQYQTQSQTSEALTRPRTNLNDYSYDSQSTAQPAQQPEQFNRSYTYSRQNVDAFSRDGGGTNMPATTAAGTARPLPITAQASPNPVDLNDSLRQMSLNESNWRQEDSAVADDDRGYETARRAPKSSKTRSKRRSKHSKASTVDQSSVAPNFVPIKATEGETELLRSDYQKQDKPKRYFKVGVVFACLWSEPAGSNGTQLTQMGWIGKYGEPVYSSIRRFIVVEERRGWSTCLPISTYGGRGCAKPNVGAEDHAAVFTHEWARTEGEPYMPRNPIEVVPNTPEDVLEPESRVNFCKLYSVEHYVKVKKIGQVSKRSLPYLVRYFEEA